MRDFSFPPLSHSLVLPGVALRAPCLPPPLAAPAFGEHFSFITVSVGITLTYFGNFLNESPKSPTRLLLGRNWQ